MSDHLVLSVDHLITSESLQSTKGNGDQDSFEGGCCSQKTDPCTSIDIDDVVDNVEVDEETPLIDMVECRICQEEDGIKNLEVPCACSGSLKFAHRKCVQRWCNEKGDIICEICRQPYQPNYTAPTPQADDTSDNSGELNDARLLAIAAAERRLLEAEYDEYADTNTSGAAFCRSAALILMALLLLRHAVSIDNGDDDEDEVSAFFSLFLLRVVGFLLPCYIMAWAISIVQQRRQRQEDEAALAANEVAFLVQTGHRRGLHLNRTPGMTPDPEPLQ